MSEQRQLEKENERLAAFPSGNPNPIFRFAHNATLLYANEASRFLMKEFGLVLGARAPEPWCSLIPEVHDLQENRELEFGCVSGLYSALLTLVRDIDEVYLYCQDLTDRIKVREELQISLSMLNATLESTGRPRRFFAESGCTLSSSG